MDYKNDEMKEKTEFDGAQTEASVSDFSGESAELTTDDISMLRKRAGVKEIETLLKPNMFGSYSKKQIQDYVDSIAEQHKKMEETFRNNIREISEEKEDLRKKLEENQRYIKDLEERNQALYSESASFDKDSMKGYESEVKNLRSSVESMKEENHFLKAENEQLHAKATSDNRHIEELETRYREMTAKLLEYEGTDTEAEKEKVRNLEQSIAELRAELEERNGDIEKLNQQINDRSTEIEDLRKLYENVKISEQKSRDLTEELQKSLHEKSDIIAKNAERYEQNINELEAKYQDKLSELSKSIEKAHAMVSAKDEEMLKAQNQHRLAASETEKSYQDKLESMMKNLLEKDDRINELAGSLEQATHSLRITENELVSLRESESSAKASVAQSVEKLDEISKRSSAVSEEIETERQKNVVLLKDKITLELDLAAKSQQIRNLEYRLEVMEKANANLTSQMELDRARAKELIAEFGTTRKAGI